MARYDYTCEHCGETLELTVPIEVRDQQACPACGTPLKRLFSPPTRVNTLELRAYPLTTDHIDGEKHTFRNRREHKDFVKHYNDTQTAKGRPQWRVVIPALE